jgi:hypothetical protein
MISEQEQSVLFFTIASRDEKSGIASWKRPEESVIEPIPDPEDRFRIEKVFYYLNMYICILPPETLSDMNSQATVEMLTDRVKEIIRSILPQEVAKPDFGFRWAVVPLNQLDSAAGLEIEITTLLGASGGGNS